MAGLWDKCNCDNAFCILFLVVEAIEVVDTLAVSAFGYSLPLVKPR